MDLGPVSRDSGLGMWRGFLGDATGGMRDGYVVMYYLASLFLCVCVCVCCIVSWDLGLVVPDSGVGHAKRTGYEANYKSHWLSVLLGT